MPTEDFSLGDEQSRSRSTPATAVTAPTSGAANRFARPADSYGLVLVLLILAYIANSFAGASPWDSVAIFMVQGLTLFFALRTSRARPVFVLLAAIFLVGGTVISLASALVQGTSAKSFADLLGIIGGVLLLVTPVAIVRRLAAHRFVTAETLLGAVCVYVLIGFSFSSLFTAVGLFSPVPFFTGVPHATRNAYIFFSYSTLTTVGYGNLVPATSLGQTLAMLEAMLGQIYLVTVVSRLVALWGQAVPRSSAGTPDSRNTRDT